MVFIYLDHVIVASRNMQEHIMHLMEVLQRLRESNLKLKHLNAIFFSEAYCFGGTGSAQME